MNVYKVIKSLVSDYASEGQRLRVLTKFFFAHIRFLFKDKFTFNWINGIKMYAVHHRTSSTQCYYYGRYDRNEMQFLERYLHSGDVFADIGSNIGSYALLAASCSANVVAVEPAPSTYMLLKDNISLNQKLMKFITPKQCALGDAVGEVEFTLDLDSTNHIVRENENRECLATAKIPCMRIDDFLSECNAMKIDVEGYELQVLRGGRALLAWEKFDVLIIEAFDTYNEVCDYLYSFGFKEYHYNSNNNTLEEGSETIYSNNALFIKNIDYVLKRINENYESFGGHR